MILSSILQGIGLFIATNIDDIIVLSLFFARGAGQHGTTARIFVGQYLGSDNNCQMVIGREGEFLYRGPENKEARDEEGQTNYFKKAGGT